MQKAKSMEHGAAGRLGDTGTRRRGEKSRKGGHGGPPYWILNKKESGDRRQNLGGKN